MSFDSIGNLQNRRNSILKGFINNGLEKAKSGIYADTPQNRKLGRVGQKYGGKKQEEDDKGKIKLNIKDGVATLLKVSSPQDGAFISTFSLVEDYKDWKEDVLEEVGDEYGNKLSNVKKTLNHFEQNVRGKIIEERDLLTDDEADDEIDLEDKYEVEKTYPISKLQDTDIDIPKGAKYFMILPVDYNRGTTADIGIAFMTKEGKKHYSKHLAGDY